MAAPFNTMTEYKTEYRKHKAHLKKFPYSPAALTVDIAHMERLIADGTQRTLKASAELHASRDAYADELRKIMALELVRTTLRGMNPLPAKAEIMRIYEEISNEPPLCGCIECGHTWNPTPDQYDCPMCGYDGGEPQEDTCPECGETGTGGLTMHDGTTWPCRSCSMDGTTS